ncbi:MAG TPA: hypothetical protein PK054_04560 [Anaerohalosphaeraceae bacterium]|nr:hypothetical protein [Anaerohalosphaeraceae bacterium]HOL87657.1 hypothetical protein [Anaerohalosphaeraceae bacterium]HPP55836.1 hypothetical protein [Anaerohalosphaeraceae bacterium]
MDAPVASVPFQDRAGWSRTELLFAGTAGMLLTGILLPWSSPALDVLWILQLSLTAAVVLICLRAQNSSQLDGFPLLTAAALMLSFLTVSGCLKAVVFHRQTCGRLVGMIGWAVASLEPLLALLAVFLLGFFLLYLVRLASRRMHMAAEEYFFRILPFKKAGLKADRSLQILTSEQAQLLAEKIRKEIRFYASMEQIRKLFLAQITVNVFLLLAAWPLAWLSEWLQSASAPSGQSPLETLAPPLAGTALLAWIPAAIAAGACAALLSRESLALPSADSKSESAQSRTIRIRSCVSGRTEEIEILNPQSLAKPSCPSGGSEQIADFEPSGTASQPEIRPLPVQCSSCEEYYSWMEEFFTQPSLQQSCFLLTSESVKDLPVNTVVHPALRLARRQKNVLLLDADPRNAVAKVFSLDPATLTVPAAAPHIPHLWLQTVRLEEWLRKAAEPLSNDFVCRLLYAPQALPSLASGTLPPSVHVLFFSTKSPAQVQSFLAGYPSIRRVYLLPPLSAVVRPSD